MREYEKLKELKENHYGWEWQEMIVAKQGYLSLVLTIFVFSKELQLQGREWIWRCLIWRRRNQLGCHGRNWLKNSPTGEVATEMERSRWTWESFQKKNRQELITEWNLGAQGGDCQGSNQVSRVNWTAIILGINSKQDQHTLTLQCSGPVDKRISACQF